MYRTIIHTEYSRTRHLKKYFSVRNQKSANLRIFSYTIYIHIPKEKRTKLDPLGKKGIFVGYSESSKAYRIYFPGFKKIDISKDVTLTKIQPTSNPRRDRLKNLKKQEHPKFMIQP